VTKKRTRKKNGPNVVHFLKSLVDNPEMESVIGWQNKAKGQFKVHDREKLIQLWCHRKNKKKIISWDNFG
jgi:hypothetical protein